MKSDKDMKSDKMMKKNKKSGSKGKSAPNPDAKQMKDGPMGTSPGGNGG
jgi:hypothetical protein